MKTRFASTGKSRIIIEAETPEESVRLRAFVKQYGEEHQYCGPDAPEEGASDEELCKHWEDTSGFLFITRKEEPAGD